MALDNIEHIYCQQSQSIEFPDLNELYYITQSHTPTEELAESLRGDPVIAAALKHIVAACTQLSTTVCERQG